LKEAKHRHHYSDKHIVAQIIKEKRKWLCCFTYRPVVMDCEAQIYIKQGRHPVLDSCLPENKQYVPNDTHMNVSESCNYCSEIESYKVSTGQGVVEWGKNSWSVESQGILSQGKLTL